MDAQEPEDQDSEGEEIDLEDILSLDALSAHDASSIARDITVAWIQNNKYEDNLTEEEVGVFYKTMYQAARFPTLWDDSEEDDGIDSNGSLKAEDDE